jgi:hypothetical protein
MAAAPVVAGKAKVEIGEGTSDRDVAEEKEELASASASRSNARSVTLRRSA